MFIAVKNTALLTYAGNWMIVRLHLKVKWRLTVFHVFWPGELLPHCDLKKGHLERHKRREILISTSKQKMRTRDESRGGWKSRRIVWGRRDHRLIRPLLRLPCLLNSEKRLRLVMDGPVKMMVFLPEMLWHSCLATRLWSCGLFFKVARPSVPWPSFRWTEICAVEDQTPH